MPYRFQAAFDNYEKKIADLKAENAQLRQQVGRLEDENIFLQEKLALEENPNTTLGKKVRELENANRKLRAQAEEILDLKAENAQLRQQVEHALGDNDQLVKEHNILVEENRKQKAKLTAAENQNAALGEALSKIEHFKYQHGFYSEALGDMREIASVALISSPPPNRIAKLEIIAKHARKVELAWTKDHDAIAHEMFGLIIALADLKGGECGED